ncbi:MAG: glycerophosphodiester phosphodiesterase family protein [Acetobacteraceae bacterium]
MRLKRRQPNSGPAEFRIIGHRGARGLFPENTIEGIHASLASGVTRFEIDVGVTADGVAVVYHDPLLNPDITRGPDGAWLAEGGPPLCTLKLAELHRFDVGRIRPGSAYAARYPEQEPADGARIPTLEAMLRAAPEALFTIELKSDPTRPELSVSGPEMAERVVATAERMGAIQRIRVQSFDWRGPRHLRRVRPDIARAWLTAPKTVAAAVLWWGRASAGGSVAEAVAAEGGGVWSPERRSLKRGAVEEAHRLGIAVIPWTVNEPAEMARLKNWGVDGLISDRPDLARGL